MCIELRVESWNAKKKLKIIRFRHSEKLVQALYRLRDKYAETYAVLKDEKNFFALLSFFETNVNRLKESDSKESEAGSKKMAGIFRTYQDCF